MMGISLIPRDDGLRQARKVSSMLEFWFDAMHTNAYDTCPACLRLLLTSLVATVQAIIGIPLPFTVSDGGKLV